MGSTEQTRQVLGLARRKIQSRFAARHGESINQG